MKCIKCKKEISNGSKFCANCGEKIDDESINVMFDRCSKSLINTWFLVGFAKGASSNTKKESKWFKEHFEDKMKEEPILWDMYQEALNFCKENVKRHDEKEKLSNSSDD
jgi:hypothetical protein